VASPSKQGYLYVFDRVTGEPVWPIEERPVPQSDVPGEKSSKTQPFPTKPPAYARNVLKVPDDLIDFTPELRAMALDLVSRYKVSSMYTPPVVGDPKGFLGALTVATNGSGATNWPGGGFDPETGIFYSEANNAALSSMSLRTPPPGFTDIRYVQGRNDQEFRENNAPGAGSSADAPQPPRGAAAAPALASTSSALLVKGLPIIKPPYGLIAAIDVNKGEIKFQVPNAETPDAVRNHPDLKGQNIPNTGQQGSSVGILLTKTLLVVGDGQLTATPRHPRGALLRAYDKNDGKEVGAVFMPAPQSGSPMSYMVDGRQYIVVAVSGGSYSGEYIAFALPGNN
jgi:quinoprotein glucose dehydrogenase